MSPPKFWGVRADRVCSGVPAITQNASQRIFYVIISAGGVLSKQYSLGSAKTYKMGLS